MSLCVRAIQLINKENNNSFLRWNDLISVLISFNSSLLSSLDLLYRAVKLKKFNLFSRLKKFLNNNYHLAWDFPLRIDPQTLAIAAKPSDFTSLAFNFLIFLQKYGSLSMHQSVTDGINGQRKKYDWQKLCRDSRRNDARNATYMCHNTICVEKHVHIRQTSVRMTRMKN